MNQEIYVKIVPKSCKECPHSKIDYAYDDEVRTCKFQFGYIALYNDKFPSCPLKSPHDHDKELVAKVFEEIKLKFSYYELADEIKEKIDFDKIKNDVLDQIQKGVKDE